MPADQRRHGVLAIQDEIGRDGSGNRLGHGFASFKTASRR
jgi:hypothetical protein